MTDTVSLDTSQLPIYQHVDEIVQTIREHKVVVVEGPTGSGKTTQLPRILLAAGLVPGRIGVTQPRRIAATSLARRVADERCEQVGGRGALAGYQVRLESKRSDATRLLFCTTGIALRMMLSDPPLPNISHVVVDEVRHVTSSSSRGLLLLT